MNNVYYKQTIQLLIGKPEGMKLCNIASNLYNMNNTLFSSNNLYDEIYKELRRFLWRQSKQKQSPFMSCRWGYYGIKKSVAVQFELPFDDFQYDTIEERKTAEPQVVQQPNLFNW